MRNSFNFDLKILKETDILIKVGIPFNRVGAILYHLSANTNDEERHKFCPRSQDSWCKFQAAKITQKSTNTEKSSLLEAIKEIFKPVFKDMSSDELLGKCLHGQTQNANEGLNKLIWQRCLKTSFASRIIVEIAASSAVICYNDGASGVYNVLEKLGISPGTYTVTASKIIDER